MRGPWKLTVDIKQHLDPEKPFQEVGKKIVAEFRKHFKEGENDKLDEVLDYLTDQDTIEGFNFELDCLYDWADDERVWCGL